LRITLFSRFDLPEQPLLSKAGTAPIQFSDNYAQQKQTPPKILWEALLFPIEKDRQRKRAELTYYRSSSHLNTEILS
jgi:hypothetical protein